jgi:hypothetical protein
VDHERWPRPDGARIKRVHGARTRPPSGSWATRISETARVVETVCGRPSIPIIEFVTGVAAAGACCAPVADGPAITGADIDDDNLAWCRAHLPFATYVHLPLHPPSLLPERSFDLLIGLSIFTHLSEPVQFEWLGELQRVSAPGATLLMSIHGPTVHATTQSVSFCAEVSERGIVVRNHDPTVPKTRPTIGRHIMHDYVRREWSRYSRSGLLPACIGNVQTRW